MKYILMLCLAMCDCEVYSGKYSEPGYHGAECHYGDSKISFHNSEGCVRHEDGVLYLPEIAANEDKGK